MDFGKKQTNPGRSTFMNATEWLGNTLAAGATFFVAGPIYSVSVDWVIQYGETHYGTGLEDVIAFGWGCAVGVGTFSVARASIAAALVSGGMGVALRLFA